MLRAIIGDNVGSRFEFNNHRSKDFDLFAEGCFATDDSIMSLAVAKALMEASKAKASDNQGAGSDFDSLLSDLTVKYMQVIGHKYPDCGFGGMFYKWVFSDAPEPYNSFGNGAAMRVSPAGLDDTKLSQAIQALMSISQTNRLVGIISHVTGLDEKIGRKIVVTKDRTGGSRAEIVLN